jgi:hypothetical protein
VPSQRTVGRKITDWRNPRANSDPGPRHSSRGRSNVARSLRGGCNRRKPRPSTFILPRRCRGQCDSDHDICERIPMKHEIHVCAPSKTARSSSVDASLAILHPSGSHERSPATRPGASHVPLSIHPVSDPTLSATKRHCPLPCAKPRRTGRDERPKIICRPCCEPGSRPASSRGFDLTRIHPTIRNSSGGRRPIQPLLPASNHPRSP